MAASTTRKKPTTAAAKKPAATAAKKPATTVSDKPAASQRPKAPNQRQLDKKQEESVKEFMSTGIDFTPFVLDAGDGVEWEFTPDPMPAQTEALSKAMNAVSAASSSDTKEGLQDAYNDLIEQLKARLMNDEQRADFPKPYYGQSALTWLSLHLATGRDGFPTE